MSKNMAVAYAMNKKRKKMADGGAADEGPSEKENQNGVHKIVPNYDREHNEIKHGQSEARYGNKKDAHKMVLEELRSMPKPKLKGLADGGEADDNVMGKIGSWIDNKVGNPEPKAKSMPTGQNTTGANILGNSYNQTVASQRPPQRHADGGFIGSHQDDCTEDCNDPAHLPEMHGQEHDDMVSRAMMKYAKGGMIANGGEDLMSHMADSKPNNFDYLAMEDDQKMHDSGADDGDEHGDARLDHDNDDIVARAMRSRAKKDRLPSPR